VACARPDGASCPLKLNPEVEGVVSSIWGHGGVVAASPGRPQLGNYHGSAAALCLRARSYAALGCKRSVVICSLWSGRVLVSRMHHRVGVSSRRRAPVVLVECGTAVV
jgi:hypothetical protein